MHKLVRTKPGKNESNDNRGQQNFKIDGQSLECYILLGSLITKDGKCTKEIKRNQKKNHDGKISYVKIGKYSQRQKCE